MKKLIFRTAACLIVLVGSAFGRIAASAEDVKTAPAVVVTKSGTETEYASDKMKDA